MPAKLYLRPVGRLMPALTGHEAYHGTISGVGGSPGVQFAGIEIIERDGAWTNRRLMSAADFRQGKGRAGLDANRLAGAFERLTRPRQPIDGFGLERVRVMGVVNVTPDSFSDGGRFLSTKAAVEHALRLVDEGADILDIGGESTRPGAEPVPLEDELARVIPVVQELAKRTSAKLSVDTRKSEVMRRAAAAGAHIINDISALGHDPRSTRVAADTGLPVVLMHALGDPRTMQQDPRYDDVVLDVADALAERIDHAERAGIARERLLVDPGIGFGKTVAHNVALLASLSILHSLGCGVVLGASRKSFIGALTGTVEPAERLGGSLGAALIGIEQGVHILRVHDVAATRQAIAVATAIRAAPPRPA